MTTEQLAQQWGKSILRPLGLLQLIFLITFIVSPFIWIWFSLALATKVGMTGLLGLLIVAPIYNIAKKAIVKAIEEEFKKPKQEFKSKFLERLEKIQEERKGK